MILVNGITFGFLVAGPMMSNLLQTFVANFMQIFDFDTTKDILDGFIFCYDHFVVLILKFQKRLNDMMSGNVHLFL